MLCSDGLSGMVRTDELRDVLATQKDPLDACKELTDRANRAGGHDNITVIVADFDGPALPVRGADDELSYKKYALPDLPQVDSTQRAQAPSQVTTAPLSEEAQRESRRLKVGHTMVGIQFSLPDAVQRASNPGPELREVAEFGGQDEPITLPVSGLPPAAVGVMVLAAMILVALTGFFLLR